MAFQTFNGVYGPITPQFISPASASLTGLDPMSVYGTAGLPPMPGTPAAYEMKNAGKKHSHKGIWGTVIALGLLVGGGFAAWKMGADALINAGIKAIKEKGFLKATSEGFTSLWGSIKGMTWKGFSEGVQKRATASWKWLTGLVKRPPSSAVSNAGSN